MLFASLLFTAICKHSRDRPLRRADERSELPHRPRSGEAAKRSNPTSKERWLRGHRRPEASYPTSDVGAAAETSYPTVKERWLRGSMRAERSYSTFKVRRGDFVQDKEQRLCFAGAAVKR